MDAPQLSTRWPARYATVLSEDPGCSVLTLTSRALMTLQHITGARCCSSDDERVVALWRDDQDPAPKHIVCPADAHGVCLKIWGTQANDVTFDGRRDERGVTWRHGGHRPLRIDNVDSRYSQLIGPEDASLRRTIPQNDPSG